MVFLNQIPNERDLFRIKKTFIIFTHWDLRLVKDCLKNIEGY